MVEPLKHEEFQKIRTLLLAVCGIDLRDDQDYLVETRLTELANEVGAKSFGDFHQKMNLNSQLMAKIVDLMTTNETLWFRDDSCWLTIEEVIIPRLIEKIENGQSLVKIWSAACSTGQEVYSLAILIDEILKKIKKSHLIEKFSILGTDISQATLFIARRASYDPFSISRGMSKARLEKYFVKQKSVFVFSPEMRNRVEFRHFNLMDSFMPLGRFDFVLCRNVAIYFSNEFKEELFERIHMVLVSNGYFMLGATESLLGIKTGFENLSFGNGLYYQAKTMG